MLTLLGFGFLVGMRHAFEADHAAALATLATKSQSISHTIKQGVVWGFGHTLTLLLFSSLVFLLGSVVPEHFVQGLEFLVGCMLVGLGIDVLRKFIKERIHFHVHQHSDQAPHFHAHSHKGESVHTSSTHDHAHPQGFPYRALFVGLMHGMAGSAALILLTLQTTLSPVTGLIYIVVFGLGSIAGMATLSLVIALPLQYTTPSLTWLHNGLQGCIGIITVTLGVTIIYSTGPFLI
jgi:hypothetical protein